MAYEQAGYTQETPYNPKHLLASGKYTTRKVTILSGQNLVAGAVIGAILLGSVTVTPGAAVSATPAGTPGNGSIGTVTSDAGAPEGTYLLVIIEPAANGGTFEVIKPDGSLDGTGVVGQAYNGSINFTLADGGTDFVAGDRIPIVVDYAAGSGKYKLSLAAAVDGSETPDLILSYDVDASDGDVEAIAYETGNFASTALTLGTGHTIDSIRAGLRDKGITIDG
ncbi:head decoration protein [Sphingobium sp. JS3065]|uniref:head decoration protein n=1 Tax=Sphingobium sp. JS3065 TaxID=2970925 RepID=UPI002264101A|nr:head decoration protein [Sphingobium sp. JS3065]UZW55549.1 head decoration protein [Sphingobium sp. JS3065]